MEHLKPLDEMHHGSSQPLGDVSRTFPCRMWLWELRRNLFFTKGVVLELLSCLLAIHGGSKHVVQPKLAREHVHQDVHGGLVTATFLGHWRALVGKAIQNI